MQTTRRSFFQWAAGMLTGAAAAPAVARSVVETDEADFRTPFDKDDDVWEGTVDNLENPCDTDDERLTAMQRALLESRAREVMISGERACGKTHALMRWMAQKVKDSEDGLTPGAESRFCGLMLVSSQMQRDMARDLLVDAINDLGVKATPEWRPGFGTVETKSGSMVQVQVQLYRGNQHMLTGHLLDAAVIDTSESIDSAHYVQLLDCLRKKGGFRIAEIDYDKRSVTMDAGTGMKCQVAMTREAAPNRGAFGVSGDAEWIKSVNISFALVNGFGKDKLPRQQRYCRTDHFTTDGFTPETFIDLGYRNWLVRKRARSVQFP